MKKNLQVWFALLIVASLVLAACGSAPAAAPTETAVPTTPAPIDPDLIDVPDVHMRYPAFVPVGEQYLVTCGTNSIGTAPTEQSIVTVGECKGRLMTIFFYTSPVDSIGSASKEPFAGYKVQSGYCASGLVPEVNYTFGEPGATTWFKVSVEGDQAKVYQDGADAPFETLDMGKSIALASTTEVFRVSNCVGGLNATIESIE